MTASNLSSTTDEIYFSVNAANKVSELIEEEHNNKLNLRVSIIGGGCSGFQYNFSFDEEIHEDDIIVVQKCTNAEKSVRLVIDSMSYPYLQDAEIDYIQGIQGEQFVIRNPNAKTTCGCGSSFSMNDEEED